MCLSKFREPWGGGQGPAFQVNGLWPVNLNFPVMQSDDAPGALFSREQPISLHRVGSRELAQPENDRLPLLHDLR